MIKEDKTVNRQTLYERLDPKLDQIADMAINDTNIIKLLLGGLSEDNARIKFGCSNTLIIISERQPNVLYPFFHLFQKELKYENRFVQRAAIIVMANLTKVDHENKFDKIFGKYYSEIAGPNVTTASYIIRGSAVIAKAKPYLTKRITKELLRIKRARFQTPECKNVALGYMISSFDKFFEQVESKKEIIGLINEQTDNPRRPTKNKADRFIKKWVK